MWLVIAFLDFLHAFFAQFPDLAGRPFYVTGESYAGHYVPAIGYAIVASNAAGTQPHINLKGIAVGNGLVEPLTQYGAYADYMFANNMVSSATHDTVNAAFNATCAPAIVACQSSTASLRAVSLLRGDARTGPLTSPMTCILAADTCNAAVVSPLLSAAAAQAGHSINVYDIRDACTHPPLCYDFSDLETYMALPDVRAVPSPSVPLTRVPAVGLLSGGRRAQRPRPSLERVLRIRSHAPRRRLDVEPRGSHSRRPRRRCEREHKNRKSLHARCDAVPGAFTAVL